MTTLLATPTEVSTGEPGRTPDEAQLAAAAFLARYRGRTLEAYRYDLRSFFQWAADHHLDVLTGQDVVVFVDNEVAASAFMRGASSSQDVCCVVQAVHWLALRSGMRFRVEGIDSKSNPSDGLSRAGLGEAWTQEQGWQLAIGE